MEDFIEDSGQLDGSYVGVIAILGLLISNELESGYVFAYILCVCTKRRVDDDDFFL